MTLSIPHYGSLLWIIQQWLFVYRGPGSLQATGECFRETWGTSILYIYQRISVSFQNSLAEIILTQLIFLRRPQTPSKLILTLMFLLVACCVDTTVSVECCVSGNNPKYGQKRSTSQMLSLFCFRFLNFVFKRIITLSPQINLSFQRKSNDNELFKENNSM
jgi:hypothetical protein